MDVLLLVIITGLLATAVMTGIILILDIKGWATTEILWPISGLFTEDKRKARWLGISMHIGAGLFFTLVYLAIWSMFDFGRPIIYVFLGAITGAIHGLFVGIALIGVLFDLGEHGFRVAAAQAVAHIAFGLAVGLGAAAMQTEGEALTAIGQFVRSSFSVAE